LSFTLFVEVSGDGPGVVLQPVDGNVIIIHVVQLGDGPSGRNVYEGAALKVPILSTPLTQFLVVLLRVEIGILIVAVLGDFYGWFEYSRLAPGLNAGETFLLSDEWQLRDVTWRFGNPGGSASVS
jgi:hypothetical protein